MLSSQWRLLIIVFSNLHMTNYSLIDFYFLNKSTPIVFVVLLGLILSVAKNIQKIWKTLTSPKIRASDPPCPNILQHTHPLLLCRTTRPVAAMPVIAMFQFPSHATTGRQSVKGLVPTWCLSLYWIGGRP